MINRNNLMRVVQGACVPILLNLCIFMPIQVFAETEIFNGAAYDKLDIASCREEAGYEALKGDALLDYVETCLEDFQGIADYENMAKEKTIQNEKKK